MKRGWIIAGALVAAFVVIAGGVAIYAYRTYVPHSYTASAEQLDGLSQSDREIVSESTRLGNRAGTLGEKLGQAALFGDTEGSAQYGSELRVIGDRLLVISKNAQNPQLKSGLAQAGRGAILTADGIQESAPSKVDEGLKLIKQSQETLRSV